MKNLLKYYIVLPSGNPTMLIESEPILDLCVDTEFLVQYGVEQVGYINLEKKELQMAGGELCINATRAFMNILFEHYGIGECVIISAKQEFIASYNNGISSLELEYSKFKIIDNCVQLDGITHILVEDKACEDYLAEARKIRAEKKLSDIAQGVVFYKKIGKNYTIKPVVSVKSELAQSEMLETACGSGTLALAFYLKLKKLRQKIVVSQPSGFDLEVEFIDEKKVRLAGKCLITKSGLCHI